MTERPKPSSLERLTERQRESVERLLHERVLSAGDELASLQPVSREGVVPLSYAQQRLWFLAQLAPDLVAYNLPVVWRLVGELSVATLEASIALVVSRHEVLRTTFGSSNGEPAQEIGPSGQTTLPILDLSGLPDAVEQGEAARLEALEADLFFDLMKGPLLRAKIIRLNQREHLLLCTLHQIIADSWSLKILARELAALYDSFASGKPSPLLPLLTQYADYSIWQRQRLSGETLETNLAYWRRQLSGLGLLELPTDRPHPAVPNSRSARQHFRLDIGLKEALQRLSRREGATLFMALLASVQVLLSQWTSQDDIPVGTLVPGRNMIELESLIGRFSNELTLRGNLSGGPSFRTLLNQTREFTLGAFAHQVVPFEIIVEEVSPERDLSRAPLFQVLVTHSNKPVSPLALVGLTLEQVPSSYGSGVFDLAFQFDEEQEEWGGAIDYRIDLFDAPTVKRLISRFEILLEEIAANPEQRIPELRMLPESEQAQLLWEWNDTASAQPNLCLQDFFTAQAARTPGEIALIWGTQRVTYRELDSQSNRLARCLSVLGVGPEVSVGVCLERSPELVIALLAVLKAGGAYVPLDPNYPVERLAFLLADSGAALLVSSQNLGSSLPHDITPLFLLEEEKESLSACSDKPLESGCGAGNLAYIIYTSGSTGRPKGVAIEHRSATMLVRWATEKFSLAELSGILAATTISFDLSIFEIYVPLAVGGKIILASDPFDLPSLPAASEVTLINTVPVVAAELLRMGLPAGVRSINVAGEQLLRETADAIYKSGKVDRVLNLYGPSEDTTYSTCEELKKKDERQPAIGRPINGKNGYIVNHRLDLVPLGASGELYLGGVGLARCYLGRPELTAERFIPNPFGRKPGSRLYRTGDRARHRTDGRIEFLGRDDYQVKVRGFRIELGEIEAALARSPSVLQAAVLARQDAQGLVRLVAYIVPAQESILAQELRDSLRERLPEFMVPSSFVVIPALPLTANGKLDRRALPAPESVTWAQTGVFPPSTPEEEILVGIWEDVLGLSGISIHDSFFELGGHSLLATRVLGRVREAFGVESPLGLLFEHPTVHGLAAKIDEALGRDRDSKPFGKPTTRLNRPATTLASFAQERFWLLAELGAEDDVSYNVPVSLQLEGELKFSALSSALRDITKRHEVLRSTFALSNNQLVQQVAPPHHLFIPVIDLQALPQTGATASAHEVSRLWDWEARGPFDLSHGPLIRAVVLRLGQRKHQLLVTFHHIVIDAWSIEIFERELEIAYRGFSQTQLSSIPELDFQYSDFADRQRKLLADKSFAGQLKYWKKRLDGAPEVLTFPTDRPRPKILSSKGKRITQPVDERVLGRLRALARHQNATLFMVLLAAFEVLLRRCTDREDLVFGIPVASRRWQESENVIGLFLNTVVLRDKILGNPRFEELPVHVRETFLGALENQDFPFEKIVEEFRPVRSLAHSPLFQLLVVHRKNSSGGAGGLIRGVQIGSVGSKFDMTFSFLEAESDLVAEIEFNRDLYDESTVRRILWHFFSILEGILEEPWRPILDYDLLRQPERHLLLTEWNDTQGEFHAALIPQRFACQARLTPEALAVVCGGENLTYGELDTWSGRLGRRLEARGVGPEVPVALLLDRTPRLLIAVLAVLRAGGAYVPLDPETPTERLEKVLGDLENGFRGAFVLAEDRSVDRLPMSHRVDTSRYISFDRECIALEQNQGLAYTRPIEPQNLAYILYTSGTSGAPKGVAVAHRSVAAFLDWAGASFSAEERRAVLAATPLTFDLSVFELFLPLTTGGCVMMHDAVTLLELGLRSTHEVSLVNTVPSLIASLLESGTLPVSAATVNLAGEALRRSVVNSIFKSSTVSRLLNLYGPTESTVYATRATIYPEETGEPSLGRPIRNTQAFVVNKVLELQPIGAPGELVLGGVGIARGYWNRPALTAERFIPNPFGGIDSRLYRTGDLVRWLPDGQLELLGRLDRQVKIRGLRIEPGDVEASLLRHPAVGEVVVMAKVSPQGEPQLVAYVEPKDGDSGLRASELRSFLKPRVPRGLVPSVIVFVKKIPRTVRGKVDLPKLPEPDWTDEEAAEFIPPRSPGEKLLAGIWTEVLGVRHLSGNDNFFDRGGHSLHAAKVVSRLQRAGVELTLRRIFEKPQLGELAREIEERLSYRELEKLVDSGEKDLALWASLRTEAAIEPSVLSEAALTPSEEIEITDLLEAFLEEKARALKRHPILSFPANCTLDAPAVLRFQLVAMAPIDSLLQRLARLRALRSARVETLFVKVTAPSFRVSPNLARVQVPVDGDSDLVAFKVIPLEEGIHVVEVEVFSGADRVGYLTLETEVILNVH